MNDDFVGQWDGPRMVVGGESYFLLVYGAALSGIYLMVVVVMVMVRWGRS